MVLYSEFDHENNQSTHVRIIWTSTKTQKLFPIKKIGGRIFATTTAVVQAQKNQKVDAFSWAQNTARGVRFLLDFHMSLILAQCQQVYLFLALALKVNKIGYHLTQ